MISVILTTYNRRALLARALASVFAQTLTDREVIVADDGSTDGSDLVLQARPVVSINLPHSGNPAIGRNAALALTGGDLIAFLDSDDVWHPTALAQLSAALAEHPDAGFAFCDYEPAPSPSPPLPRISDLFDPLLESDFIMMGGVLLRRSVVSAVGDFDPLCTPAEDWDYWLRAAARFRGVYVPHSLIRISSDRDSLSRRPGGAMQRANIRVTRKAVDFCITNRPQSLSLARRAHRRSLVAAARYAWQRRAFGQTMGSLVRVALAR